MKKSILSLIAITTLLFTACKKDKENNPGGKGDTYQPFTAGSVWKYRTTFKIEGEDRLDTTINTMTAATKTINGKTYHVANSTDGTENEESYIGINNDVYSTIMYDAVAGGQLEYEYLNTNKAKGESWQKDFQIEDGEETYDVRIKTTIVDKGINKTVLGKDFNNVIQSKIELSFKVNGTYVPASSVDFYAAKGIGIIGIYSKAGNDVIFKSELFNYTIK
jgi:hypothetical protein